MKNKIQEEEKQIQEEGQGQGSRRFGLLDRNLKGVNE